MPSAPDAHTLLQRVLLLERQQGFQDRAAVGGISAFARLQIERGGAAGGEGLLAVADSLRGYEQSDRNARESAVAAALQLLLSRGHVPSSAARSELVPPLERPVAVAESPIDRDRRQQPPPEPSPPLPRPARPKLSIVHSPQDLDTPISSLKGMRKPMSDALDRLGVHSVRDVLYYFPRAHYDYTDTRSISRLRVGTRTTLVGTIRDVRNNFTRGRVVITTATIEDDTGVVAVRWFNQPYLTRQLPVGARIAITGEPDVNNGRITFVPRDYELIKDLELTHAARLVPVYPLTKGLYQRSLRQFVYRVVEEYGDVLEDFLPDTVRLGHTLPALHDSVAEYHFPTDLEQKERAQRRLAFDELLLIQLGLLMRKAQWQQPEEASALPADPETFERFKAALPFALTDAQSRVIAEISADLSSPAPMSRLLQGDVGSGKTVVAAAALLQTVRAGKQGVLMAPTEILAEQHFHTLHFLLDPFDVRCELLVGSMTKAQKRQTRALVAGGTAQVVVGTHALIQDEVELPSLGLAITDEQHRFGVEQRTTLRQKGLHPHTLAMTATPIPRTLAMTIYGDLDVSSLDQMPPGRLPVITTWSRTAAEAYGVVRDEVRKGRQAFIICPVIEESADSDMRSVIAEHKELQSLTFSDLNVGLLHGRMKASQKDETLAAFRRGDFHVLVATSVVEVGIDVPNATVMVIRDAHRFGLAQLHQFRGRVGRGGDQAFCVLLSSAEGDEAVERLHALTATEDGFELAEEDLRLRGPGEFWGTRQSGLPTLRVAQLGDVATIELARSAAVQILREDPGLDSPEHNLIRDAVTRFWANSADLS
jgi:ATP-dependent DNA helicase RecG